MSDARNKLQRGNNFNHWKLLDFDLGLNYFSFSNHDPTHSPKH